MVESRLYPQKENMNFLLFESLGWIISRVLSKKVKKNP
jgi:hypothetical protein